MTPAWRKDLADFLAAFVESHRGLRNGRLFGRPVAIGPFLEVAARHAAHFS